MEQTDLNKRLDVIIEKRKNCIQLTKEEEVLANESLNKLLDAKKCVCKTMANTTGDDIRKKAMEGPAPKDRPKEGGYDSKADVAERKEVTPGSVQPDAPVVKDPLTDKKEEKIPSEKTDGKPYGDKTKEEWADADEKKFKQENYQEDRLANMTEHADYKDSIRVSSIVTKSLSSGSKMVGQVLKVYNGKNGQVGLMIKWADGRFEHVNQSNVELLKSEPKVAATKSVETPRSFCAGDVADFVGKLSDEEFASFTKSLDEEALQELSVIMDDMNKGWKGAGKGAKAGLKIGAVLGGLGGAAAGALQGGMTRGVPGAVAGGVIGGAAGATSGAVSAAPSAALVGHVIEEGDKPKKIKPITKVEGSLAPDEEKKAVNEGSKPEATDVVPPKGEELPTEAPEEFVRGVIDTLSELTDLSQDEIVNIAKEAWGEIVAEEATGEGTEEAPAEEAKEEATEAPVKEEKEVVPAKEAKEEEKAMEAGDIQKEPKK